MAALDLFESLLNCNTVEELHTTATTITRQMGFEHFLYGVKVKTSLTRPYQFVLSGYPKQWRDHYVEMKYQEIDPTVAHCRTHVTPVIWRNQVFQGHDATKFQGEAKEAGLKHGATFVVHGGRGETAMLSLATTRGARQAESDVVAHMGQAQLFTCYLHEAVQRIVLSQGPLPLQKVTLTPREKECLLWVAEGKTSWEIGNIVRISQDTVKFHLKNASRKMGVTNGRHAVSRAVSLGLIAPK